MQSDHRYPVSNKLNLVIKYELVCSRPVLDRQPIRVSDAQDLTW